jgi:hypothetical protein
MVFIASAYPSLNNIPRKLVATVEHPKLSVKNHDQVNLKKFNRFKYL